MAKIDLAELEERVDYHPGSHPRIHKDTILALIEAVEAAKRVGRLEREASGLDLALAPFTEDNE